MKQQGVQRIRLTMWVLYGSVGWLFPLSLYAADTTPPTTPLVTDGGFATSSTTTLGARWASSDAESGIAEYQYLIRQDSTVGSIIVNWTSTGTTTSVTRSGLSLLHGKTYYFGVRARNGVGLWSVVGYSDGIKVDTTAPSASGRPSEGSPDQDYDTDGSYTIYWGAASDPDSGISSYELQEATSPTGSWTIVSGKITATSYAVSGRTHGTTYYYKVRARNGAGTQGSSSATSDGIKIDTTGPSAPGQPTEGSPDADYDNDGAYTIYWTATSDAESGIVSYELLQRIGTSGAWTILSSAISGTSFTVSGRLNGTTYHYQVRAKNGAGTWSAYSVMSDGVTVDTQAPTVSAIGVTNITVSSATLNWTTSELTTCTLRCGTSSPPTTSCATTLVGTSHTATLTSLAANTTYYVGVSCQDRAGNLSATSSTSFTTQPTAVPTQPSITTINGRQLMLRKRNPNGTLAPATPYVIRGVDWSPSSRTSAGGGTALVRRPEFGRWYLTDIPLLKAMNVNTVRTFMDFGLSGDSGVTVDGKAILDEFYRNGIMVIMTVDDGNGTSSRVSPAVTYYRNHPAILAWSLGSEWNINLFFEPSGSVTLDQAAQRIENEAATSKSLDANHPVISSYGEFDLFQTAAGYAKLNEFANRLNSKIDIWSFNLYRGDTFGSIWTQWAAISAKPMFIAEFGADAFHATQLINNNPPGAVNQAEQAQWSVSLWDDIARHLSAVDSTKEALGGTVFEWNDEWWKVTPPGSQETSGWFSEGFLDGMGNEEFFGLVDIDRVTRQVYGALQNAFTPTYVPPALPSVLTYRALSRGTYAQEWNGQYGKGQLYVGRTLLFARYGGGGGGRGINIAAINRATGQVRQPPENFDLWYESLIPARDRLVNFVNSQPNGTVLLMAVGDTSGTTATSTNSCSPVAYFEPVVQALETLGSRLFRTYCFRGSWAMITVKGEGTARAEQVNNTQAFGAAPVSISADIVRQ